jgi:hypothetical protein
LKASGRRAAGIVAELTGKGVVGMFVKNGLTFTGDKRDPMATLMLTMLWRRRPQFGVGVGAKMMKLR